MALERHGDLFVETAKATGHETLSITVPFEVGVCPRGLVNSTAMTTSLGGQATA
jgi:hypothetical protein